MLLIAWEPKGSCRASFPPHLHLQPSSQNKQPSYSEAPKTRPGGKKETSESERCPAAWARRKQPCSRTPCQLRHKLSRRPQVFASSGKDGTGRTRRHGANRTSFASKAVQVLEPSLATFPFAPTSLVFRIPDIASSIMYISPTDPPKWSTVLSLLLRVLL
jgi:hypothetical protein